MFFSSYGQLLYSPNTLADYYTILQDKFPEIVRGLV
ncbi:hypothetical protein SSU05_1005 [Streptococcus suis 05ZYH33]|nr:hypothetical protein SSU05_1005 [Streptococcus suis 05ZYH33]